MNEVYYNYSQIRGQKVRALKYGLLDYAPEDILRELTYKHFSNDDGNLCDAYTGEILTDISIDHVISVSLGGGTVLFNMVPTSRSNNSFKRDNNLFDWWRSNNYDLSRHIKLFDYILDCYKYVIDNDIEVKVKTQEELMKESDEEEQEEDNIVDEEILEYEEIVGKHDIQKYIVFLHTNLIVMKENGISNELYKYYEEKVKDIEDSKIFEELDNFVKYQHIMVNLMDRYFSELKYKISDELDYQSLVKNMEATEYKELIERAKEELKENYKFFVNNNRERLIGIKSRNIKVSNLVDNNRRKVLDENTKITRVLRGFKNPSDIDMLNYLLEKRIRFLSDNVAKDLNVSDKAVLAVILKKPDILYISEDSFKEEKIKEEIKKAIVELKNIPMVWKDVKFNLLLEFYDKEKRWPKQSEIYQGENIGTFLNSIKSGYAKMEDDQKKELLRRDSQVFENFIAMRKNKTFNLLLEFYDKEKRWPKRSEIYQGENIGRFLNSIKQGHTTIDDNQREKLLSIDSKVFDNPKTIRKNERFDLLLEFYDKEGRWPHTSGVPDEEIELGLFFSDIKRGHIKINETQNEELHKRDSSLVIKEKKRKTVKKVTTFDDSYEFDISNGHRAR